MVLLPTLRQKKRYILFKIDAAVQFSFEEVKTEVERALLQFLGEFGVAKAAPMFIKEKYKSNQIIVKMRHTSVDEVKAALILIKKIKNTPVLLRSIITSGTLKKVTGYIK